MLEITEDDPGVPIFFGGITPDVILALNASRLRTSRALKPRVLVGCMVNHQLRDHPQRTAVRLLQQFLEIVERAINRIYGVIISDVVPVIAQRRGIKGQQPKRRNPEILEIIELLGDTAEITDAIAVAIVERSYVRLVNDRVAIPHGLRSRRRLQIG